MLVIGGSDLVDGYIARRFESTSRTGVILDAVADRFAQFALAAFYVFVDPRLSLWLLGLLVARDLIVGAATVAALRAGLGSEIRHEAHGRLASTLMFALFLTLLMPIAVLPVSWMETVAALAVAVSTLGYVRSGFAAWRGHQGIIG